MWFNCDVGGIILFLFGYIVLIYVDVALCYVALHDLFKQQNPLAYIMAILYQIVVIMILWAHISCMTADPGVLPKHQKTLNEAELRDELKPVWDAVKQNIELNKEYTSFDPGRRSEEERKLYQDIKKNINSELVELLNQTDIEDGKVDNYAVERLTVMFKNTCYVCDSLKPPKAHHCSTCKRCIARMDHHGPWMNNCIGAQNMKLFLVLLAYVFIGTAIALVIFAATLSHGFVNTCEVFKTEGVLLLFGGALLFSILFGLFSTIMFISQLHGVIKDTSTIDKMQGIKARKTKPSWELVKDVFGGDFSIKWFLPTRIKLNLTIEDQY